MGHIPWNKGKFGYKVKPTRYKICQYCGKKFDKPLKDTIIYWNKRKFCNKKCYIASGSNKGKHPKCEFKVGDNLREKHWKWKGGKIIRKGYVYILEPKHPLATKSGYVLEHYLIAEKMIGRNILKPEVIHHINKNKFDNNPNNLYLFPSQSEHIKYHFNLKNKSVKPITKSNLI